MRGRVAIIALGDLLYSAQRKSVTSAQALANPFDKNITLDPDFLAIPGMADTITDQHFVERDRMGRTLAFMARLATDGVPGVKAIAIDRETAGWSRPTATRPSLPTPTTRRLTSTC